MGGLSVEGEYRPQGARKTRRGSSARSNSIGDDRRKLNQQIIDIIIVNS
jgi:hypothetical protein